MTYDAAGHVASRTDERGFTTALAFDNLGRLTQITAPDNDSDPKNNPVETLAYDAGGNLVGRTDPLWQTTALAFNAMNQLVSTTGPDPDGGGPLTAAVTTFDHDAAGNLTGVTDPLGRGGAFKACADRWSFAEGSRGSEPSGQAANFSPQ